jgi:hypothetical protein
MASSPATETNEVAAAVADAAAEGKEKGKRGGVLGRMWRALFGGREDFEKRLRYLSKEEAAVHARMRRRTQFSRRAVRNLIVLSVLAEVVADFPSLPLYLFLITEMRSSGDRVCRLIGPWRFDSLSPGDFSGNSDLRVSWCVF